MIDGDETDERFSLVEHPMSARALAAPLHRHTREDEYSYVLEGSVGALLGDDVVIGKPGDLIFKPRDQWHTFWNAGDEPARILEIISPAGFERFFAELVDLGGVAQAEPQTFVRPVRSATGWRWSPTASRSWSSDSDWCFRASLSRPRARRPPRRPPRSQPSRRGRACAGLRGTRPRAPSSKARAASGSPRCSSISEALQIAPAGFAMPRPAMSGAEPCTGSKRPGSSRSRREVGARGHPHPALDRRGEVGEDVAEEVRGDDDVEPGRVPHHPRGERVDEHSLVAHARELGRDLVGDLVPEHVAVAGRIRLRRAREDAPPAGGELERVAQHALDALPREDARLHRHLACEALVRAPADPGVLALGVLAHEQHVDVGRRATGERARHACRAAAPGRTFAQRSRRWRISSTSPHSET